jgi:hypothetical protein
MLLLEALRWSGLERSDRFIGSEPGLRGELPASGAQMLLLEALLWSGLERSDKNKDNLFRDAASNVSSCSTWQLKN